MAAPDVVDVLIHQHDQIRRLCADVERAGFADRTRLFAELEELVNMHERGERAVVHPAARNNTPTGDRIGVACAEEEGRIERTFGDLHALGITHPDFDSQFARLRREIHDHAAREENHEFPLLRRYVTTQRLHMMAGELHDVQVMAVR